MNSIEKSIGDYKKDNGIYDDLSSEGSTILDETKDLNNTIGKIERTIEDLTALEIYVRSNTVYDSNVPEGASMRPPLSMI